MKEFVLTNPFKLFTNLHFIDKSADRKLSAIDNLTDMKSKAALPDLVRSMHDLDPRVRQRAVQALGEIGDRRAAAHLVAALDDPLEDLRAEAAEALGRLGDRSAIGPLVNKLDSGDMHMVRCAITALGELQAAEAAPKIAALLNVTGNTGLLLACADALGRLRCFESIEPLLRVTRLTQNAPVKRSLVASVGRLVDDDGDLYRALSEQELYYHAAAREILGPKTVRLARDPHSSLRQNVNNAYKASTEYNFNEAVLEMKVINLNAVLEFLSDKNLKRLFGFDKWVRLLDADYATQVEAVYRIDRDTGVALAVVDYYARHCPTSSEPDMDQQEFLLALYAFRAGQAGLNRLIYEKPPMTDTVTMRLGDFSRRFDDDETGRSEQ